MTEYILLFHYTAGLLDYDLVSCIIEHNQSQYGYTLFQSST